MKNLDVKKLLVLIIIIAIIVVVLVFGFKLFDKSKLSEEETTTIEGLVIDYYANMTRGYSTYYGGLERLYGYDKLTKEELDPEILIYTATTYIEDKNIDAGIDGTVMATLSQTYSNITEAAIYRGSVVRDTIKELFDIDFTNTDVDGNLLPVKFIYDIIHDTNNDVYIIRRNSVENYRNNAFSIDYKTISTEKNGDKVTVTIAIGYIYQGSNGIIIDDTDDISEPYIVEGAETKKLPADKIDSFTKYKFTLKENNGKYTFESIEKVK